MYLRGGRLGMQITPDRLDQDRTEDWRGIEAEDEIDDLPRKKRVELFESVNVIIGDCVNCSERTWLIGASGRNCTSERHNCGKEYRV